jgi:hypothetical protein
MDDAKKVPIPTMANGRNNAETKQTKGKRAPPEGKSKE